VSAFMDEGALALAYKRESTLRMKYFQATASGYFQLRTGTAQPLDLTLLQELLTQELSDELDGASIRILFREFVIR